MRARVLAGHPGMPHLYSAAGATAGSRATGARADGTQVERTVIARSEFRPMPPADLLRPIRHGSDNSHPRTAMRLRGHYRGRDRGRTSRKSLQGTGSIQNPDFLDKPPSDRLARLSRLRARLPAPTAVPVRIGSPAMATPAARRRPQFGLKPAEPVPAGEVLFKCRAPQNLPQAHKSAEPLPSRRQSVAFVRAANCRATDRGG